MKTAEYLDAIKERHNLPSDYAAAKLIGVTRSAVSRYRHGADSFADPVALRVAALLDLDPASVLIDCQMERAPDPATRAAWGALLARIGTHAAPLVVLLLLVTACDKFALDSAIYSLSMLPVTVFRTENACFALLVLQGLTLLAFRFQHFRPSSCQGRIRLYLTEAGKYHGPEIRPVIAFTSAS